MINSPDEFLRLRSSEDPVDQARASNDDATDDIWLAVLREYPDQRVWVAHNKSISDAVIEVLARDPDPQVRMTVAAKRKTPPEILRVLARDAEDAVRARVAHNKRAPRDVLAALAEDEYEHVRRPAASQLSQT